MWYFLFMSFLLEGWFSVLSKDPGKPAVLQLVFRTSWYLGLQLVFRTSQAVSFWYT